MIPRYQTPEMTAIWSDTARFSRWLEVEILVAEALAGLGVIPEADAVACRARAPQIDDALIAAVAEREAITDHDVAAFVDVVQDRIGAPAGAWIHYGLTSSDVVDTAQCWAMRDAVGLLLDETAALLETMVALAVAHRDTPMIGRTHGMHAEPTTFGAKVALWALQVDRDRQRLGAAQRACSVMKLSGAVGTYSNIPPEVESMVAERLGLIAVPATQVIARDRHGEFLWACTSLGTTLEMVAVELRHLQRSEVSEVYEQFKAGQKGSSAMPHKRNPISAETISGLSRVLRGNLQAGLQDVALWHERDISHSSVERVILPDSSTLAHYMTRRLNRLLERLEVDSTRMMENLRMSRGAFHSQGVLLALVQAGLSRDDAYRMVQRYVAQLKAASDPDTDLRSVVHADPDLPAQVRDRLDELFDLQRAIRHAGRAVESLDQIQR
jgi:adenylosuccinate lyase